MDRTVYALAWNMTAAIQWKLLPTFLGMVSHPDAMQAAVDRMAAVPMKRDSFCPPRQTGCDDPANHDSLDCYPRYVDVAQEVRSGVVMSFEEWLNPESFTRRCEACGADHHPDEDHECAGPHNPTVLMTCCNRRIATVAETVGHVC